MGLKQSEEESKKTKMFCESCEPLRSVTCASAKRIRYRSASHACEYGGEKSNEGLNESFSVDISHPALGQADEDVRVYAPIVNFRNDDAMKAVR